MKENNQETIHVYERCCIHTKGKPIFLGKGWPNFHCQRSQGKIKNFLNKYTPNKKANKTCKQEVCIVILERKLIVEKRSKHP